MKLKLADYNSYEKTQYERGIAFAKNNRRNLREAKPADADADSWAFMRGFVEEKYELQYGPIGDDFRGEIDFALTEMELEPEYFWYLEMLDRKLFLAILKLMDTLHEGEGEEVAEEA